jgi:hypothetical protein
MGTLFDTDGNEVEAFTKEEVNQQIEDAKTAGKEEVAEELNTIKTQLDEKDVAIKELEDKIAGSEGAGGNFRKLREAKDKAEKDRDALQQKILDIDKDVDKKISGVKDEIAQGRINDEIKKHSGGDAEIEKKIRFHYGQFKTDEEKDPVKREENFKQRLEAATLLASGGKPISPLRSVAGTGGGYVPPADMGGGKISDETKQMGKDKFGLTDEDFKKAGAQ